MQRQRKSYSTTPTWTTYKAEESRSVNLKRLKNKPGQSWKKVGFTLHKWHSNVEELESISNETEKGDPTRKLRVINDKDPRSSLEAENGRCPN